MMRRLFPLTILFLLLAAAGAPAAEVTAGRPATLAVLSIIPAQGEPGMNVTVTGSGFTDQTVAYLANQELPTEVIGQGQLVFTVPQLAAGQYAFFLKRENGVTSHAYAFTIVPARPSVEYLNPDKIPACASNFDREVTIYGESFQAESQLLLDGAAIRSRFLSSGAISFAVPQLPGGMHQVQVRNPGDMISGALALMIDTRPEINSVNQGENNVNYYNLIIEGRNFQQNSTVVIMEEHSYTLSEQAPTVDVKRLGTGLSGGAERDRTMYVNCNKIIYQRYPYSPVTKSFQLQVLNPGGEESPTVWVSAP
ncbi:MAG TPA: IPT/TIG domain-containing protein [Geobacteraceae bacterium]